jgi:hypothetical protein
VEVELAPDLDPLDGLAYQAVREGLGRLEPGPGMPAGEAGLPSGDGELYPEELLDDLVVLAEEVDGLADEGNEAPLASMEGLSDPRGASALR